MHAVFEIATQRAAGVAHVAQAGLATSMHK